MRPLQLIRSVGPTKGGGREALVRCVASVVLLVAAGAPIGCSETDRADVSCPPYIAAGLNVSVANDQSNDPICDALVTARDGSYSETLMPAGTCRYVGAIERAGTYSVLAERTGFAAALTPDLKVVSSGGDCPHVRTVDVAIRLAPAR